MEENVNENNEKSKCSKRGDNSKSFDTMINSKCLVYDKRQREGFNSKT